MRFNFSPHNSEPKIRCPPIFETCLSVIQVSRDRTSIEKYWSENFLYSPHSVSINWVVITSSSSVHTMSIYSGLWKYLIYSEYIRHQSYWALKKHPVLMLMSWDRVWHCEYYIQLYYLKYSALSIMNVKSIMVCFHSTAILCNALGAWWVPCCSSAWEEIEGRKYCGRRISTWVCWFSAIVAVFRSSLSSGFWRPFV